MFFLVKYLKGDNNMDNAIKEAIKIIESYEKNIFFKKEYTPIYMFTTENINAVINHLNIYNRTVLTVSSSGDQIFNMLLNKASLVESFDINYFLKYYFYFKEASIRTLNYNEFLDFYFLKKVGPNNKVFNDEVFFKKILPSIKDNSAKKFWETLFKGYSGKILYNSNLFIRNNGRKNTYIKCNNYLHNEANYIALKKLLINYNYIYYQINIFENITALKNQKYDIIYLSNILDKLEEKNELLYIKKLKEIIKKLKKHITPDGLLGLCYLYLFYDEYWETFPYSITSNSFRYKYLDNNNITYNSFNGFNDIDGRLYKNRDALMLIKKR